MIPPQPEAAALVNTFYIIETGPEPIVEPVPAYAAQLLVMVRGQVRFTFADGSTGQSARVFINAPQMRSARARLEGPVLQVGASLTHTAWQRLANLPADEVHDRLIPAEAVLTPDQIATLEAAATACEEGRIAPEDLCQHLAAVVAAAPHGLREDHVAVVEAILRWLASGFDPALADLHASVDVSPRQLQRISRRFFGVAPAQVLKRFRALRAAMMLAQPAISRDLHDQLWASFFDQAHLIRDIRRYTGRTPSQFREGSLARDLLDPAGHGDAGAPLKAAAE
ncbi:helix-turn-helix domain-containing protein [Porphyrobacter sp. YT40]|uniref:helix-turn-helix transcriptional regulator n=1 Tax=Porphyrobacter sp. YT40 TaxID=2547601 RepID=UPI001141BA88|nr:helix-turn-helix domain-containing protein [Porphyrobacter sp. YT40]QDH33558.1 helix-turn-helix domain-containing protein [Porphyrobacter sp. YT40]